MKWIKKGLIYGPGRSLAWAQHSALTPTPMLKDAKTIRIYAGFRDQRGVSRIGYVDVEAANPSVIKKISKRPVLDVGIPGTFDDNGVILGDVIKANDVIRMYYVGFQLVQKVKFLAFSGLAISRDNGDTFERVSSAPILDRGDDGLYFRAIHSVIFENGIWKAWCGAGSDWETIDGGAFPKYTIKYYESADGIHFPEKGITCLDYRRGEYRLGRPRVYKKGNGYRMFFTKGTIKKDYSAGYAESEDGVIWSRMDAKIGIKKSKTGWDSKMLCYPSVIEYNTESYMFYNGNNFGYDGIGYAILAKIEQE